MVKSGMSPLLPVKILEPLRKPGVLDLYFIFPWAHQWSTYQFRTFSVENNIYLHRIKILFEPGCNCYASLQNNEEPFKILGSSLLAEHENRFNPVQWLWILSLYRRQCYNGSAEHLNFWKIEKWNQSLLNELWG